MTSTPQRIALVTGASRGIGHATARALAAEGLHVIATARTVGGLEDLDDAIRTATGQPATLVPLDLKDADGIDRLGAAIFERWGRLDVLVANAGVLGPISPLAHVEPKRWDEVITVNLTANWRLIRAMDPLLRLSDSGRVVFVSSSAATKFRAYWGPYAVSKAALEALAQTYALETATTNIRVSSFNPGRTATKMRATAMPGEDPASLPTAEDAAARLVAMTRPDWPGDPVET